MRLTPNAIPILELEAIGSTNAEAMRQGLEGAGVPFWVRADRQTSGRGRSGRLWTSEPGNLYASLLVQLSCPPTVVHHLSFIAAVAVVAALRAVAEQSGVNPPALRLKWPNDILIDDAKLVGILPESTILGDRRILAVIGVGVNLAHAPHGVGRATTCLAAHGITVAPALMLDALSVALAEALALWDQGRDFATIRSRWLLDGGPLGAAMTVNSGESSLSGTFAGLDHDGALILRDHSGYDHRRTYGDVTLEPARSG